MLVLSLGFILQLVPAVEHSFYCQIFKLFEVILSLSFYLNQLTWVCWLSPGGDGSWTIAPEENCPPTPKLTLTQPLTLTGG